MPVYSVAGPFSTQFGGWTMSITSGPTSGSSSQTLSSSYETLYDPTPTAGVGGRAKFIAITNNGSADAVIKSWSWVDVSGTEYERLLPSGETIYVDGGRGKISAKYSSSSTTLLWHPVGFKR